MTGRISDGPFGPRGTSLGELTDDELQDERARRRGEAPPSESRPTLQRVKQYLANLELGPGATWPEVERAYKRLRERYSPKRHEAHPERHATALELDASLNRAYEALRNYFRR